MVGGVKVPKVMVGDAVVRVSWAEMFFALLPENTPIRWRKLPQVFLLFANTAPESGEGVFLYSWFYDGVIAEVEADGKRFPIMCGLHDKIVVRRVERPRKA